MGVDFKELYAYSVSRIKENINFNYAARERQKTEDMMRSDVIVASDEKMLSEIGLDFDPFDKMDSGTMFEGLDDYKDSDELDKKQ